jgi:hypothetical protein
MTPEAERRVVAAAVLVLPPAHRARYREELLRELDELEPDARPGHLARVVRQLPALRHALLPLGLDGEPAPFLCRWHLHHHWATFATEDGERYSRCKRCGRDDPRYQASRGAEWARFPARSSQHR